MEKSLNSLSNSQVLVECDQCFLKQTWIDYKEKDLCPDPRRNLISASWSSVDASLVTLEIFTILLGSSHCSIKDCWQQNILFFGWKTWWQPLNNLVAFTFMPQGLPMELFVCLCAGRRLKRPVPGAGPLVIQPIVSYSPGRPAWRKERWTFPRLLAQAGK